MYSESTLEVRKLIQPYSELQNSQRLSNDAQQNSRETLRLSNTQAAELVERLYGFKVESVKILGSYGDYNFHVKVSGVDQDHHGFVLKVMNADDSQDDEQIAAQTAMMMFLESRGFQVQRLQQDRWGNVMSLQPFRREETGRQFSTHHNVRLMTYLPGSLARDVAFDSPSFLAAGVYVARTHQALKDFNHPGLHRPSFKWNLRNLPAIRKYLHILDSEQDQQMVKTVLDDFVHKVLSRLDDLPQGPTHADFTSSNILVKEEVGNSEAEYQICGLLDFGDAVWNPLVFDVAITLVSFMLTAPGCPIAYSAHFLTGYESIRALTEAERAVLYHCVVGPACQLYVLNAHTVSVDPEREDFITRSCPNVHRTLKLLVETPKHEVDRQWLEREKFS